MMKNKKKTTPKVPQEEVEEARRKRVVLNAKHVRHRNQNQFLKLGVTTKLVHGSRTSFRDIFSLHGALHPDYHIYGFCGGKSAATVAAFSVDIVLVVRVEFLSESLVTKKIWSSKSRDCMKCFRRPTDVRSERRGTRLLENLKTSGIFCQESRGWTTAIVVKGRKGEKLESVEVVAKEKKKQAAKSVEREVVATYIEVNLDDNEDGTWDLYGYMYGYGNVYPEVESKKVEQSGAAPENLSRAAPENLSEA
ncbi:hypothetical protein ACFE04_000922 [Oxalis oulophora]